MGQVLLNLINNSFDAIQGQESAWIRIHGQSSGGKFILRVSDSGSGIPDEVVDKMMNPFFTTKPVGKGTGLGLSVARGLINEHGGELSYELFEGHTSFVIELPIYTNAANQAA